MAIVRNPGYTKPSKEEMREAIQEAQERAKDMAINGKDYKIDHDKKIVEMNMEITSAFEQYLDNLKNLVKFMDDFNMPHIEYYKLNQRNKLVEYEFDSYKIYGNTKEENGEVLLDKFKDFMVANGIRKFNITNPDDPLTFLTNVKPLPNSDPNAGKYSMFQFAVYYKAKRLQELYTQLADNRYFVPEFIISLPVDKVSDYFFMHIVNQNLCDGLMDSTQIDPELHERLHWKFYPVIFIDREQADKTRDTIKASLKFLNEHNEYLL